MNIVGRRKLWFIISLIVIIPGTISLILWGLKPGIDFTGGQEIEVSGNTNQSEVRAIVAKSEVADITVTTSGNNRLLIRYSNQGRGDSEAIHQAIKANLAAQNIQETAFSSVGPTVSRDITRNALLSVFIASLAIICYIAFAFRKTPPPLSSWSFGVTAIIAVLHDVLLVLGVFSLLGHFFGIQVDSLFVTAILTVIGFSVHDTIVVYDRIRENLRRYNKPFEELVNDSILETFARSINTSLTVIMVLLAFFLFGGESIKFFILALLIGIFSGTYSSIFNAAPLLVVYNNWKIKRSKKGGAKNLKPTKA
ncbi:protein translocase subunit SecF [Candidatus Saccharibacteria bacterium]|nr:protein translocase subunit SecF [Candidatus Saccharibacteria bacterium]